ncbi:hypothetical protein BGZ83_006353 [Gryganskiella cystojenkinii]|nr:hypothetical protein BGZ83_006353 [Gryganskiella cystojenkinii]
MADKLLTLFCVTEGESALNAFKIKNIPSSNIVDDLKSFIVNGDQAPAFRDVAAKDLVLWRVSIPLDRQESAITVDVLDEKTEMKNSRAQLSLFFPQTPDDSTYVIVKRPPLGNKQWGNTIAKIESDFFASEPMEYARLVEFVKGGAKAKIPTTEGNMGGLPCIRSRASAEANRPSLLFLNLPESSEAQDPPSTADTALEKIRNRAIPLLPFFGVTGCGKTRTAIKILSKNWGFYFNGSGTDLGSVDLVCLLGLAQQRNSGKTSDKESNTYVHTMALALVLSRVIILHQCLDIAEREQSTFTCKDWMLFQVGIRTRDVKDMFATLFGLIMTQADARAIGIMPMMTIVQVRFSKLRQRLLDLTFSTSPERFDYKILLVVDEAQTLDKKDFESQGQAGAASPDEPDSNLRPILSPLVHGLYLIAADKNEFCVIPCGTDLSIYDMRWLEDSALGPKGHKGQLGPFTDFTGWRSVEQVQNYRDLVRRSLSNDEARTIFDSHVPLISTPELFKSLHGRFRPIVFAIERMIMLLPEDGEIDWKKAIKETDKTLTSMESQHFVKGNIAYDIARMIRRVHEFPSRYEKYHSIQTTLKAFVLEHYLHGRPLLLHEEEAPLVEASVGRILHFGEETATVLDEPFALRAAVNYFRQYDPGFHSAICTLLGSVTNASVHGHQWKMTVLPSLAHIFHDKILSNTPLVPEEEKSREPVLTGKAEIVGYVNHLTLGTDFKSMSLDAFLDAHVNRKSLKDGKPVPPFYHPAETPSGPDIVFVLHFVDHGYCPVFVQLKMRHKMAKTETQSAFSAVKSEAVQGHLQESVLQTFCTGHPKRFLGVVIAYPAELAGVDGAFPEVRRSERIRLGQGDTPQCISLRIDTSNIHDLFPHSHMQALDLLKGIKQQLDQTEGWPRQR